MKKTPDWVIMAGWASGLLRHAAHLDELRHDAFSFAERNGVDPEAFWRQVIYVNRTTVMTIEQSLEYAKENFLKNSQ